MLHICHSQLIKPDDDLPDSIKAPPRGQKYLHLPNYEEEPVPDYLLDTNYLGDELLAQTVANRWKGRESGSYGGPALPKEGELQLRLEAELQDLPEHRYQWHANMQRMVRTEGSGAGCWGGTFTPGLIEWEHWMRCGDSINKKNRCCFFFNFFYFYVLFHTYD